MHGDSHNWSYAVIDEPDGSCRVEVTDEDGEVFPVARQVTHGQAEHLIERIAEEARSSGKPIKVVIRDPYFMAATVITLKRQAI
jgi:flagellar motor protein MotB